MKRITEIMRSGENNAVSNKDACFREVLEIMDAKRLGVVCIVDEGKLIGIVTDGDLRRLILKTQDTLPDLFMKKVNKIMTLNPKVISSEASLEDCLNMLKKHRFWVIPVVNEEQMLLGVVHMQDLLEALI
ncbi:MAG: CBS domain-containing protein [Proteobacteria bacterium]|nr:CBS domain-containing protein [Pseudomonadota bacterium]MBU4258140.1 CBS domain-containing protein [Pseudomonadota bacterium]MBU4286780.1 CBS domain-containing protein [Pseudomonadota bacterium]MBU4413648.1 CBS domain-containing protein [Pseudomonadota bacterium]MCG2758620.1 CBS domain-containing protein [Desulfobacteraceae bacterium]